MISVCCCSFNAKFDTDIFVRTLHALNPDTEFEVIITHDDRVDDGSGPFFKKLCQEFSNVKIVTHSEKDTRDYFQACLNYYKEKNIFRPSIREALQENFDKYKEGLLIDPTSSFLWQSSGILYNKAVAASCGDIVIVTPGDFLYLFALKDIESFVKTNSSSDIFYSSPPALWARATNIDLEWMQDHIQDIQQGKSFREGWRWDSVETFRDYLRYTPEATNNYIPDFHKGKIIKFTDEQAVSNLEDFCARAAKLGLHQYNPAFHGFHVMTRKTFDLIGGFSEEWFHRAFPDDKMTYHGSRLQARSHLPPKFSVVWCGQHELLPTHGPGYSDNWREKLEEIDPFYKRHPIPPSPRPIYLFDEKVRRDLMIQTVNQCLRMDTRPVRIMT